MTASMGTQVQEAGRHKVGAHRWSRPWLCGAASRPSPPLPLLPMHGRACLRAHRCRKLAGTGPEHSAQSRPWLCGVASPPTPLPLCPGCTRRARLWAHRCRKLVGTGSEHIVEANLGSACCLSPFASAPSPAHARVRMSTGTQVHEAGGHKVGAHCWSRPWLCGAASPPSPLPPSPC